MDPMLFCLYCVLVISIALFPVLALHLLGVSSQFSFLFQIYSTILRLFVGYRPFSLVDWIH